MVAQFLICCKYCGNQSMWYDVVNSIPGLVKYVTSWACLVLLFFIISKYGAEIMKAFWAHSGNKGENSKGKTSADNIQSKESKDVLEREKELSDELTILKEISRQKEALWRSYKELLEENYKEQVKTTVDDKTKSLDQE